MKPWSIRKRSIIVNIATGIVAITILIVAINWVIVHEISDLENKDVQSNVRRVEATYKYQVTLYEKKVIDWGEWDDTYQFIQDLNKKYIKSNLDQSTLTNLTTDEILYYDADANLKYATASAIILSKEPDFPEDTRNIFKNNPELFNLILNGTKASGLIRTSDGVLIFAGHPILHSDGSGTPRGIVVFGRYQGDWLTQELSKITQIPVAFDENSDDIVLDDVVISHISVPMDDRSGNLYLKVSTSRDVWVGARKALIFLLISTLIVTMISILISYLTLYGRIFMDILKFKTEVSAIAKNNGMGSVTKLGITSDIDELRDDVNSLLDVLYKSKTLFQSKAEELDRLNKLMVDREIKMTELKNIIAELKKKII